jgi:sirohydrochlorin ferrochelatase
VSGPPRLVTVAHGTRSTDGNEVARSITAQASRRLGGVPSVASYVELCLPGFEKVMAANEVPTVVVPLLLSTGHHMRHDLPTAIARSQPPVRMSRPLGPHPLLAEVMCLRLRAAGARRGDPVVMVAAGSNDPDADIDLAAAGRMLRARWGAPVRVATVGGNGRSPVDVIAEARADGRVAVAPYLLARGHFEQRIKALATVLRVSSIAEVLGAHPLVADLVVRRYRALAAARLAA